jgi:hypothetical protein
MDGVGLADLWVERKEAIQVVCGESTLAPN